MKHDVWLIYSLVYVIMQYRHTKIANPAKTTTLETAAGHCYVQRTLSCANAIGRIA